MDIGKIIHKVRTGTFKNADRRVFTYRFTSHSLKIAKFFYSGPELLVASLAFQIFSVLNQAVREFKKKHYLESISHFGIAVLTGDQIASPLKQIQDKWSPKTAEGLLQRKAAIDVGSGGTKVLIADIDNKTNQIVHVVVDRSFPVPYQASLEKSSDGTFDSSIQDQGLKTFDQIKDLLNQHQVQKVSAVATEAFRKANNGESFASKILEKTQIPLKIIPQEQEGVIAFNSALASHKNEGKEPIVWDIGTGSFQITRKKGTDYEVFTKGMGSVPFKNYIIENIQGKDSSIISTPNPIPPQEYKKTGRDARWFAKQASSELKAAIKSPNSCILGIGRLFSNSVSPLASNDGLTIERKGLRTFLNNSVNKSDRDMNNPYSSVDVPNCIQVLEVMKALHIKKIDVVNTTSTKGIIIGPDQNFTNWKK